jgi:hypothetical protein
MKSKNLYGKPEFAKIIIPTHLILIIRQISTIRVQSSSPTQLNVSKSLTVHPVDSIIWPYAELLKQIRSGLPAW